MLLRKAYFAPNLEKLDIDDLTLVHELHPLTEVFSIYLFIYFSPLRDHNEWIQAGRALQLTVCMCSYVLKMIK